MHIFERRYVRDCDTVHDVECRDLDTNQLVNLGINFKVSLCNYALSLSSKYQKIDWDTVLIIISYKDERCYLYEASYEVLFYKKHDVIYSLKNIGLSRHTYKPVIIGN